jgi:hypothetical protein
MPDSPFAVVDAARTEVIVSGLRFDRCHGRTEVLHYECTCDGRTEVPHYEYTCHGSTEVLHYEYTCHGRAEVLHYDGPRRYAEDLDG